MNAPRTSRVPQRRIAETIADELRNLILIGDDYRLPTQDQLVRDFGVSYPSIREALRILETEGLVTVRRGSVGGADVHRPDEVSVAYHVALALQASGATLRDLAHGLLRLEPLCAAECARRSDRETVVVPALNAAIDASEEVIGDALGFARASKVFHDLLVTLTPDVTLRLAVSSYVALWAAQQEAWAPSLAPRGHHPSEDEARGAVRTHRRLVSAIADGRSDDAEQIARQHLDTFQPLVLERFGDSVVDASAMSRYGGRRTRS
jgi:GntR family transcriptional regulator, transcriptional repressor for pyruvate dehydrogenase complex